MPSSIGAPLKRREDPRLMQGQGQYTGDLRLPGLLHVAFVRATQAPARITRLALDAARAMPGVAAVLGPRDLPILSRTMPAMMQIPGVEVRLASPLATDVVRYAGEAVAVVVADDPYRAADAAAVVAVDYERLPAVLDPEAAQGHGPHGEDAAPRVHDDVPGNVAARLRRGYGDVAAAFAEADVVLRERFSAQRAAGASLEPRAVAAQPGGDGGVAVTLWDSTQAPHAIRRGLAAALDLAEDVVRVITPDVGGGFGPKGRLYAEEIVLAALALHLDRPLLWQATRGEDLLTTYQGRGLIVDAELAARADGTILGLLPLAQSLPTIAVEHCENPSPNNPEGIKGAGEGGTIGALATVVGAVEDALAPLGLTLNNLPLRYEDLARSCRRLR